MSVKNRIETLKGIAQRLNGEVNVLAAMRNTEVDGNALETIINNIDYATIDIDHEIKSLMRNIEKAQEELLTQDGKNGT